MFSEFFLNDRLIKAVEKLGFDNPTPVQLQAIPPAMEGKDLLVSAKTGSGKTVAFFLPTLHRLLENRRPDSGTRALVLVPTRELARQVHKHCIQLAGFTSVGVGLVTGGQSFKYQASEFRKNPEIIIATPGRLLDHIEHGIPDFSDLEVLILDEADRMLDMGFSQDVLTIAAHCNTDRQSLLFSATLHHRGLKQITDSMLKNPEVITTSTVQDQHEEIRQQILTADDALHKEKITRWLLENETFEKAVIFTNTREKANKLGAALRYQHQRVAVLHGEMDQDSRNQVMLMLRRGIVNVLVATDVAARGLDVKGIDLVINFDMARSGDDYIHRIGRTGRAGKQGLAISLISAPEWNLMSSIERYLKQRFEKRSIKAVQGGFKGPKKLKASGKAAGTKKPKVSGKKKPAAEKGKQRHRDKKNIGKRRKPSNKQQSDAPQEAGLSPLKRKTRSADNED